MPRPLTFFRSVHVARPSIRPLRLLLRNTGALSYRRTAYRLIFIDWCSALPVPYVDDNPLGPFELIFIIGRAEIHRPRFRRSRRFHARELLLVVFHGESD